MKVFFSVALLFLVIGCGDDPESEDQTAKYLRSALYEISADSPRTPDSVYGIWGKTINGNALRDARLAISKTQVTAAVKCVFSDGTDLISYVSVNYRMAKEKMTFLKSAAHQVKDGDKYCQISLALGEWPYKVEGTQLEMASVQASGGVVSSGGNDGSVSIQPPPGPASKWTKLSDSEVSVN